MEDPLISTKGDDGEDEAPPRVPGQAKMLALSVIFVFASVFLLMEFIVLHYAGLGSPIKYDKAIRVGTDSIWWKKQCPAACPDEANKLINWLGAISCIGWFVGFALLLDWTVNDLRIAYFPNGINSRINLTGVVLKLIAAVLFNIQPWSYIFNPHNFGLGGLGVEFSNFVGICFFHTGNCINAVDMITGPLMNWKQPFCKANWPILGMQVYCLATWFLVIADGFAYFHFRCDTNPLIKLQEGYDTGSICPSEAHLAFVTPGQIIGATLLLIGSIIYTAYSLGD